ncbi:UTP--glucose-1-phosphate uridylyltransferase GalU [Jeotgalibacillus sp. R-1-5s-1]|uniref:UTP--glucose-1-phosphate uridylyltransferase GalU n=1 Tax=Jeotgalibacillus sp. R-1-5s-1 TaxID=2555897 RepID=UPI00106A9E66|nr:UTP--glucose-1-phosphate uridylyltransferase GalU [Jeotgalibacillus sp. R-1-5s-1]TFE00201.1 UTP--glucose-1-phosphate uridylyltransferase GalU [Jeotgalibacillus sp. R-1-5s-1]
MRKVKKAIIPAAGLGTRFLPATKAMPKEMLPILDKPTIQYIIEEAVAAGIEDIIIVTGKGKRAIEDHFDYAVELEKNLLDKEKFDLLAKVKFTADLANIHYIRQKEPKGLGHAIWCARQFIGNEPFAVLLGDDIVKSNVPCIKQLIKQYEETGRSIIGVQEVDESETSRYGIIDPMSRKERLIQMKGLIEKPSPGTSPSNFAILGRYILTPEIFNILENQETGAGGEVQLTDAIEKLNRHQSVYAYEFEGTRYDVGEILGFLKTTVEFALNDARIKKEFEIYLREIIYKTENNMIFH